MSKSNVFETDLLEYVFNQTPIPYLTGSNLYISLHTADVSESGSQSTNEATYVSYARTELSRSAGVFSVSANAVVPVGVISFPQAGSGSSETITHWAVGTQPSGSGEVLYFGPVSPNIPVVINVTPQLLSGTNITED